MVTKMLDECLNMFFDNYWSIQDLSGRDLEYFSNMFVIFRIFGTPSDVTWGSGTSEVVTDVTSQAF